ncbi:hypothetical protein SAMN04515647_2176 [Cohaesibacter sp. ES.047]|uniref:AbrB family transcriptional regulator n=1 Tax=Cohaesibacter sp. ES.047 TaxID=1798205 RepID=UPI000BBFA026|nr:AbrB family transcriptional regulator [Cohaesibacter sp. ES.047]SNY91934.1 hypothetical protein SAMN04515647_2176 [Cohaesibacter sp. ES.047]
MLNLVELYAIAFAGGWLATYIGFPASWLTGSLLAVVVAMFAGRKLFIPNRLKNGGFMLVGVILGTGFTPDTLHAIAAWPLSVALLVVTVIIITLSSYFVLRRVGHWDHATALFASLPGALAYVMAIAEASRADISRVAVAQSIRVFAMIAVLPVLLTPFAQLEGGAAHDVVKVAAPENLDMQSILILLAGMAIVAPLVKWFKIPGGFLLGGMAISGAFYLSGTFSAPLPDWLAVPGFLTIGALVGTRFGSVSLSQLAKLMGISLLSLFVSMSVSLIAALIGWAVLGFPPGQTFLAYAPGGFETMVLLAFLFDMNPAFVAGHHLVRYLGLVLIAPAVTARLTRDQTGVDDKVAK